MKNNSDPSYWLFIVLTFVFLMCALSYGTQWCEWDICEGGDCYSLGFYAEPEDNTNILFQCVDRSAFCKYICYPINDKGEILKENKWRLPIRKSNGTSRFG